jgi:hypothetical protein
MAAWRASRSCIATGCGTVMQCGAEENEWRYRRRQTDRGDEGHELREPARGPITIDPETRDIIQGVYIRRVERKDGELYNIEFATFPAVKDPFKEVEKAGK